MGLANRSNLRYIKDMMRFRAFIAVLMISVLFPATLEVVENVIHFINHGHLTIQKVTDHHHHVPGDGCCNTSSTHICGLNLIQLFYAVAPGLEPFQGAPQVGLVFFQTRKIERDGFLTLPFRPPIV